MNEYDYYCNKYIWHEFSSSEGGKHPFLILTISNANNSDEFTIKGIQGTTKNNPYCPVPKYHIKQNQIAELPKETWFKKELLEIKFNDVDELIKFLDLNEPKPALSDLGLYKKIKKDLISDADDKCKSNDDLDKWKDMFKNE